MSDIKETPAELLAAQFIPFMFVKHTAPRAELHNALSKGIQRLVDDECYKVREEEREKKTSFWETLVAFTIEVSNDQNKYAFLYHRLGAGYKGIIAEMIQWATDFEIVFAGADWTTVDWYDVIDTYVEETLEEYAYDKEEKYTL